MKFYILSFVRVKGIVCYLAPDDFEDAPGVADRGPSGSGEQEVEVAHGVLLQLAGVACKTNKTRHCIQMNNKMISS